jgi:hypothetical protein
LTVGAGRTFPTVCAIFVFAITIDMYTMRNHVAIWTMIPNFVWIIFCVMPTIIFVIRWRRWSYNEIAARSIIFAIVDAIPISNLKFTKVVTSIFDVELCAISTRPAVVSIVLRVLIFSITLTTSTMPKFTFAVTTTTRIHVITML